MWLLLTFFVVFLGSFPMVFGQGGNPILNYYISRTECTFFYRSTSAATSLVNCTSPSFTSTSWDSCFLYCCQDSGLAQYPFVSLDAFQYCNTQTSSSEAKSIGERIAVVSVSIFIFICISLFCIARICKRVYHPSNSVQVADKPITTVEWQDETEINNISSSIEWSSKASRQNRLKYSDQPCTICLEEYTTAELYCRHQYHPKCIGQWLRKSIFCPCCRREDIKGVKIYCEICRWRYFICSRLLIAKVGLDLPKRCQVCAQHRLDQENNSLAELVPEISGQKMAMQRVQEQNPQITSKDNIVSHRLEDEEGRDPPESAASPTDSYARGQF